jgi:glycerol kinase
VAHYILTIDQGTTGTTVSLVDKDGYTMGKVTKEFPQIYPKPGWVEHDPKEIWSSVTRAIEDSLSKTGTSVYDIAAIGLTNQRETVLIWDRKTGEPVHNAIVWQCRRTADFCEKLQKRKGVENFLQKTTGLVIDPYFAATKIRWILENVSGVRKKAENGELAVGTIDSFLLSKLTGGQVHATDVSNASRTQLMDIKTGQWDEELLEVFDIPAELLGQIVPSSGVMGVTSNCPGLPNGIPISGMAGDQQAALFGQACFKPGEAKCTYGTGSFLLMNTGSKMVVSKSGLLTTVGWQLQGQKDMTYAFEGSVFICGAAVQWLRDGLGFMKESHEVEHLAKTVSDSGGVEFVPALAGLGAPYWQPHARGLICGITRGTTKAHIARATLEAMALQNAEIIWAMEKDLQKKLPALKVDGGACANNLLMQIQADYLGSKIVRPKGIETTAAGAAYLAGLGVGFWSSTDDIKKVWQKDHEFDSEMKPAARKDRLARWQKAIKRTLI